MVYKAHHTEMCLVWIDIANSVGHPSLLDSRLGLADGSSFSEPPVPHIVKKLIFARKASKEFKIYECSGEKYKHQSLLASCESEAVVPILVPIFSCRAFHQSEVRQEFPVTVTEAIVYEICILIFHANFVTN